MLTYLGGRCLSIPLPAAARLRILLYGPGYESRVDDFSAVDRAK
jgi:hypothetical protein